MLLLLPLQWLLLQLFQHRYNGGDGSVHVQVVEALVQELDDKPLLVLGLDNESHVSEVLVHDGAWAHVYAFCMLRLHVVRVMEQEPL